MEARKLAVIMFTDMVGYSKKVGTDEDVALRLLAEHNAILEEQIRIYGGNVIKTIGDAYMVDFDSVFNAVNCASDIQRALVTRNTAAAGDPIEVRIGIHVGDVVYQGSDVFGDGVNVASRVESIADGGEVFVSHDVFSIAFGKQGFRFKDIGSRELKNIDRPVHVYEVLWDPARADEATDLPPMAPRPDIRRGGMRRTILSGSVGVAIAALLFWAFGPVGRSGVDRGRPTLAVVAFGDETGDAEMGRVQIGKIIHDAVIQKFYEFPHTRLISPLQISKAKRVLDIGDEAAAQDHGLAEQIARETEGRLMIAGTLRKLGGRFLLSADLEDLEEDRLLANVVLKDLSADNILGATIDSLCSRFQHRILDAFKIRDAAPRRDLPIGELTTHSLEAYSHFIKGNALYKSGDFRAGIDELRRATEADTGFALAYSLLACAYSLTKEDDELSGAYFEKAARFRDRFTGISKEALIFRGNDAWSRNDLAACEKNYRLITELYPDDRDGYYYYGLYFAYLKQDHKQAIRQYRKAIELNPDWYPTYRDRAYSLVETEGMETAVRSLQDYIKAYPEGMGAQYARKTIAELRGVKG